MISGDQVVSMILTGWQHVPLKMPTVSIITHSTLKIFISDCCITGLLNRWCVQKFQLVCKSIYFSSNQFHHTIVKADICPTCNKQKAFFDWFSLPWGSWEFLSEGELNCMKILFHNRSMWVIDQKQFSVMKVLYY